MLIYRNHMTIRIAIALIRISCGWWTFECIGDIKYTFWSRTTHNIHCRVQMPWGIIDQ